MKKDEIFIKYDVRRMLEEAVVIYGGVFAQSRNCGARETAVARYCPYSTIEELSRYEI
jgi:hypothetical protein